MCDVSVLVMKQHRLRRLNLHITDIRRVIQLQSVLIFATQLLTNFYTSIHTKSEFLKCWPVMTPLCQSNLNHINSGPWLHWWHFNFLPLGLLIKVIWPCASVSVKKENNWLPNICYEWLRWNSLIFIITSACIVSVLHLSMPWRLFLIESC